MFTSFPEVALDWTQFPLSPANRPFFFPHSRINEGKVFSPTLPPKQQEEENPPPPFFHTNFPSSSSSSSSATNVPYTPRVRGSTNTFLGSIFFSFFEEIALLEASVAISVLRKIDLVEKGA